MLRGVDVVDSEILGGMEEGEKVESSRDLKGWKRLIKEDEDMQKRRKDVDDAIWEIRVREAHDR